jgi:hypothetical protein
LPESFFVIFAFVIAESVPKSNIGVRLRTAARSLQAFVRLDLVVNTVEPSLRATLVGRKPGISATAS